LLNSAEIEMFPHCSIPFLSTASGEAVHVILQCAYYCSIEISVMFQRT